MARAHIRGGPCVCVEERRGLGPCGPTRAERCSGGIAVTIVRPCGTVRREEKHRWIARILSRRGALRIRTGTYTSSIAAEFWDQVVSSTLVNRGPDRDDRLQARSQSKLRCSQHLGHRHGHRCPGYIIVDGFVALLRATSGHMRFRRERYTCVCAPA